jgi:hypothetical protein
MELLDWCIVQNPDQLQQQSLGVMDTEFHLVGMAQVLVQVLDLAHN